MAGSHSLTTRWRGIPALLLALAGSLGPVHTAHGQLISPGKLSEVHASLEGISNCTRCHQLRVPGADPDRCLSCHGALQSRIDMEEGYHGRLDDLDCGTCHKEHLGTDFTLIRMEPDTFDHDLTGFILEGAHQTTDCRDCHNPKRITDLLVLEEGAERSHLDRTYLGLNTDCRSCHLDVDPHHGQFNDRACTDCHGWDAWDDTSAFDHGQTGFPLDGEHAFLECSTCHVTE